MKKILGFVLAILCFLTSVGFPVQGDEVSDLQAQLEEYKAQLEAVKTRIIEAQDHQSELLNQIEDLNAQMYEVEGLFTFFQSKMDEISITIQQASQTINEKDAEVKVIEKSLQERQSLLGQRLVTLYKLNRGKYLEILLSSKDFQEFGSRMTYFERVFRQDQNLLDQTKELIASFALQKKQLQEQRELLVRQEEQYAELKQRKEEEKSVLEGDLATKGELMARALDEQANLEGQKSELIQQIEADQAYITDLLTSRGAVSYTGQPSESGFIWPIWGAPTSYFGWRDWGDFHRGLDIGAPYGAPVQAVKDGVVVGAEYLGSYGNLILIDHLDGLQTVYAHLSGFNVDVGQEVVQGDVVGWVGMTGYTTGPHLHFEVRAGGEFVDPLGFLP
jgi:murein DD-endopeptidase MepM/ murein hydrolase activator NlpD